MREKGLILCQLIITFALTVCLSACGEDKEEVKQNDDVILGRWVMTCVKAKTSQTYTLEKKLDLVNLTQTITGISSLSDVSDHETKQYSSFEEMAEDLHLKGIVFEENGICRSIIYSDGGWIDTGDIFQYEVLNNTIYNVNDKVKKVYGTIIYNNKVPQLSVQYTEQLEGYKINEERIFVKF